MFFLLGYKKYLLFIVFILAIRILYIFEVLRKILTVKILYIFEILRKYVSTQKNTIVGTWLVLALCVCEGRGQASPLQIKYFAILINTRKFYSNKFIYLTT
ncbi:MAG: hypothetical protein EAZ85_05955 [Bacteroidetes bacterium]|nr:MAG: hypothetical protein EAZ85_05955 [Bacteroidota bacterium]TAG89650.1 MAG: hypothetical protein EAZ20_05980 [Bacteroidota bacterium]